MPKTEFDRFVNHQQAEKFEAARIDWSQQLKDWLSHLDDLYQTIHGYLSPYTAEQIGQNYIEVDLNEDNIGSYRARSLILAIGSKQVVFMPIGTMLIGTKGRVDAIGPAGRSRLVLVNRDVKDARSLLQLHAAIADPNASPQSSPATPRQDLGDWIWKIAISPPKVEFIELNQDSFFDMVLAVANG